jgi:DNA polymerase-1
MHVNYVGAGEDPSHFLRWLRYHPNATMAVDTETTGLNPWGDRLRLVQFGCKGVAYALPFPEQRDAIAQALRYCAEHRPLVGHNTKFDAQFLANNGFDVSALVDDTRIMACLLGHNPERSGENSASLKTLGDRYLNADSSKAQQALKDVYKATKTNWATIPVDTFEYWWYGGIDTLLTADLYDLLSQRVVERGHLDLYNLETDVWLAMQRAEQRGICVDIDYAFASLTDLERQILNIEERYSDINLGSTKQLAELLTAAGVKVPTTDKGNPSLTAAVIETLDHPILDDVREYRRLTKLASTYFEAFLELEVDGRIHTTINTLGARTGRMSSERPNLQNIPKREAGSFVRRAFMPSNNRTLVMADFRQIEYRIFASMCGEPSMLEAFLNGEDMHAVTAELALGHKPSEKERLIAKNANFAELYGAGVDKFAYTAGISVDAARRFKSAYHSAFPRVKPFTKAVMKHAQANLWSIESAFGRFIPVDAEKPYAAVNYLVQGSAADVLKRAIQRIAETEWDEYFVLPVHDELIFDVPTERVPEFTRALPELMEDRETFRVPLEVDVTTASRWGEKEAA